MGAAGALTGAPKSPRPRRAREIPPKAGVREYIYYLINILYASVSM